MSNQKLPLVSVVIPTYNRIRTLPASVDSVLEQTYENLELIIMDDGSTDGTQEYVESITDKRVRYRRADKNMGPSAARNMGAELAKGEYLAFQDSDDAWEPDKLEKQMKLMVDNGELAMVYSEFGFYRDGELAAIIPSPQIPYEEKHGDLFSHLLLYPLISTQTMLIKTKEFIAAGGFDETLQAYEDFEFSMRFAQNHRIGFVDEPLVRVNNTPNSVNKRLGERIRTQFYMVREMLDVLRERNLLESKLSIILLEAESILCHDIFIEELNRLSKEFLSEEERESTAVLFEKIERSKEMVYRKMKMRETIPKLTQRALKIYGNLYENRITWSGELQGALKDLVGSVETLKTMFAIPDGVQARYAAIQKSLEADKLSETERLYLLADIVELFETLEKLW
ncbi:MAG: glycosyltransferase [Lachnospiraceae bacterium]|nr:glycosyltransferase [Lachnospiraceae bacterium]